MSGGVDETLSGKDTCRFVSAGVSGAALRSGDSDEIASAILKMR